MLIDVLYTVLSALPVVSHIVQLFLEPTLSLKFSPSPKPFLSISWLLLSDKHVSSKFLRMRYTYVRGNIDWSVDDI